jgi:hypothetical protein
MDKIEKIEESLDYYFPENRLVSKINEIIDYLNQSQEQPEGEDAKIRLLNEAMLSVIEEELDKRKK